LSGKNLLETSATQRSPNNTTVSPTFLTEIIPLNKTKIEEMTKMQVSKDPAQLSMITVDGSANFQSN
jgi:hypothetical protein